jgi:hypothetical protein
VPRRPAAAAELISLKRATAPRPRHRLRPSGHQSAFFVHDIARAAYGWRRAAWRGSWRWLARSSERVELLIAEQECATDATAAAVDAIEALAAQQQVFQ